jgi:hypothetical protein
MLVRVVRMVKEVRKWAFEEGRKFVMRWDLLYLHFLRLHHSYHQIEKLSPHPQVRLALGLMNWKPLPLRPPLKSRVVPSR